MNHTSQTSLDHRTAESVVTFDVNSYRIHDEPVWLLAGELHYFKMTCGDWRRRLVQLKCAGFNTVSVYIPWNYHELEEGEWDFSGDRDVVQFLETAAELGLYVVARPGPYICDEWNFGGFPVWLSAKSGLRVRTKDPAFLEFVDRWWDRIVPILKRFEMGHGGTVILVQVENEYGHYGEGQEPEYIYHLRNGLRDRGITVPIVNCDSFIPFARLKPGVYDDINLCCNFGGDGLRNLARAREMQPEAPLFVSEYWIAVLDWWGSPRSSVQDDTLRLNGGLEIAAGGAGGLCAFVFAGGAHFGYWHGRTIFSDAAFMNTRYGPGAPILDDGTFSGKYSLLKMNLAPLNLTMLASARMPEVEDLQPGVVRATRHGPAGSFVFTLNWGEDPMTQTDTPIEQACVDFSTPARAVQWSVQNLQLPQGSLLNQTNLSLLSVEPVLILFGDSGSDGWLELDGERLQADVPDTGLPFHLHHKGIDVLVLNREAASCCWPVSLPRVSPVVFGGPQRIEDMKILDQRVAVTLSSPTRAPVWQFKDGAIVIEEPDYAELAPSQSLSLSAIRVGRTFPETSGDFNDSTWYVASQPQRMAAFGHGMGWAWYRTEFEVKDEGPQSIVFSGAEDRAHIWVDGLYLGVRGWGSRHGWHLMPNISAGPHTLAILVENLGMFNCGAEYDIPLGEPKGIYGPVWLNCEEMSTWRMRSGLGDGEKIDSWPQLRPVAVPHIKGNDLIGPAWVTSKFDLPSGFEGAVRLDLGAYAGKGSVWLNGHNIGRYWNKGPQKSLWLPLSWLQAQNTLVFFEEEQIQPDSVQVQFTSFGPQAQIEVAIL